MGHHHSRAVVFIINLGSFDALSTDFSHLLHFGIIPIKSMNFLCVSLIKRTHPEVRLSNTNGLSPVDEHSALLCQVLISLSRSGLSCTCLTCFWSSFWEKIMSSVKCSACELIVLKPKQLTRASPAPKKVRWGQLLERTRMKQRNNAVIIYQKPQLDSQGDHH